MGKSEYGAISYPAYRILLLECYNSMEECHRTFLWEIHVEVVMGEVSGSLAVSFQMVQGKVVCISFICITQTYIHMHISHKCIHTYNIYTDIYALFIHVHKANSAKCWLTLGDL